MDASEGNLLKGRADAARSVCAAVGVLVGEMYGMAAGGWPTGMARRRPACHVRQIAMYVCHVVLQLSLTDIGAAFGRDRTTVGHACRITEDRRDERGYDEFVAAVERVAKAVFAPGEAGA